MLFSIICPVYNTEEFIAECIESVRNQTFSDWELIIIDDESTDRSRLIVSNYLFDKRISLLPVKHVGQTKARQYGINVAKGDYILFLDADDCLYYDTLKVLNSLMVSYKPDVFSYSSLLFKIKEDIKNISYDCFHTLDIKSTDMLEHYFGVYKNMSLCGNAFKKELVIKGFNNIPDALKTLRTCEDFVTLFEIIRLSSSAIVINKPYYFYRVNMSSVSHTKMLSDRLDVMISHDYVYKLYIYYDNKHRLDESIVEFLSYIPIMLAIKAHRKKRRLFKMARKSFLFNYFSINKTWKSKLLKIIVFTMKYNLYILFSIFALIYRKRNK